MAASSKLALLVFTLLLAAAAFIHVASAEETHDDHDGGDHDPSPSPPDHEDPSPSPPDHEDEPPPPSSPGKEDVCKGKGCCDWSGGDCKHYCDGYDDKSCCDDWSGDCHKCCSK
ncbi:Os02g0582900 [Oryza sativa Japonica Group]|jgi:hypothetical protein|uniref:Os02g0582900 protein n=6 Tax=Oryza TaxID=4527 RepID=A3A8E8_ORYSJ|nr:uncharacterized protein LOC4329797 [Oryza sativa Japonica Group]EAY86446.1 hypothetical protein OsI_07828 [Oryza sativa Indica Group]KAB8087679.1 hypothetical protein EE612_012046 [Oryza sativa]EAZ23587.1 hypothetical protein OsJ_07288 [Oryza sativa Japonica Group]KAF2945538.1 hypothetical protein DAI22_02g223300 [Oryza sativa Japonica Group]BAD29322.1 unknown protein [Oryza sativa Japonica Group]|eukprot:NP_001047256.1 Os02g0582900 [Oryza sativa Japonica Group]